MERGDGTWISFRALGYREDQQSVCQGGPHSTPISPLPSLAAVLGASFPG